MFAVLGVRGEGELRIDTSVMRGGAAARKGRAGPAPGELPESRRIVLGRVYQTQDEVGPVGRYFRTILTKATHAVVVLHFGKGGNKSYADVPSVDEIRIDLVLTNKLRVTTQVCSLYKHTFVHTLVQQLMCSFV